ncbi:MAG TPA: nucleotidyltransferase domain-containing protein [Syntrophobacteria bacterium]|nr:nucleotidyltransferase domain-containing protein [Syntrophobacteria bacterium]
MTSDVIRKIERYFNDRPEAVAVYLFGSYAGGREKRFSDIDLGVLLEREMLSKQSDLERTYLVGLGRVLCKDCHIVIMNRAGEGILTQIFKHGKCVFLRRPEALSRFKMVSYAMIADFGFNRNLMEKGFLSRILGDGQ